MALSKKSKRKKVKINIQSVKSKQSKSQNVKSYASGGCGRFLPDELESQLCCFDCSIGHLTRGTDSNIQIFKYSKDIDRFFFVTILHYGGQLVLYNGRDPAASGVGQFAKTDYGK